MKKKGKNLVEFMILTWALMKYSTPQGSASPPPILGPVNRVTVAYSQAQRTTKTYTVKKDSDFPIPSRDVTNQTLPGREQFK